MPALPEIPARRSRGWFHPLRWRFWFFTVPVLFSTVLCGMFWWPDLQYNYSIGSWFRIERYHPCQCSEEEHAAFAIGPVEILKEIKRDFKARGLTVLRGSTVSGFQYQWEGGMVVFSVYGN